MSIPKPSNEPTIGVIDTMFDKNVYFSEWVEFKNVLDDEILLSDEDYRHGTMVTSIIVDGASINPELNDGCGRFKARHFGVATSGRFSSFTVLRAIKEIVVSNRDIKVWNLSLGSSMEINTNFISPEAAILDKIQYENDVIFVVAGTNKPMNSNIKRIGAPADSINSLVVNSVGFDGKPATYSREGLVLSFLINQM
ncbi:S8 family peptidase [Streptococcus sp. 2A/TPW/M5]